MMKRNLLLGWISLFGVLAFAQEDPVVMRINGKDIPRSEFEYSYRRHADGNGMKLSPKEYAEFFIQSKLKSSRKVWISCLKPPRPLRRIWRVR